MGAQLVLTVAAYDINHNDRVVVSVASGLPIGATMTANWSSDTNNTAYATIVWTPQPSDGGTSGSLCFRAVDMGPDAGW